MKLFKRILGVFLGTALIGLGVAICKIASLGQDPVSAFTFSLVYLAEERLPYMVWYTLINLVLLIFMCIFLRNKINIGTFISLLFTGLFCDLFWMIYSFFNVGEIYLVLRFVLAITGMLVISLGIAIYGSANLGLAPLDAIPIIISNKFNKIKYKYARIIIELIFVLTAFLLGNIILERTDIIGINTVITFIFSGPVISLFSNIVDKHILKKEKLTFD